jgi:hypothetical protein
MAGQRRCPSDHPAPGPSINLIRCTNSSGVLATGSKPSAARRCLMFGNAMILATWRLRKIMTVFGVPLERASLPRGLLRYSDIQPRSSFPLQAKSDHIFLVTASTRSLPSSIRGGVAVGELNAIGVWPPIVGVTSEPPPMNGTCMRSRPSELFCCSVKSGPWRSSPRPRHAAAVDGRESGLW